MKNNITIIFVIGFLIIVYALIGLTNHWISKQQSQLITPERKAAEVRSKATAERTSYKKTYGVDLFPPKIDAENDPLKPVIVQVEMEKEEAVQNDNNESEKQYEFSLDSDVLIQ